jgi:biopolymer transport protein ExbD
MNLGSDADSDHEEVMMDINTTPLIDVMLVLIIMLIITIPVQLHSINLSLPTSKSPPTETPVVVKIDIDFDGTIAWNGTMLPTRQDLQNNLKVAAALANQPEVHVRPNKLVEYKFVAQVLAEAQRIGITKLGMVSTERKEK